MRGYWRLSPSEMLYLNLRCHYPMSYLGKYYKVIGWRRGPKNSGTFYFATEAGFWIKRPVRFPRG